jgi:ABC-type glycerol-3-phosphate transport system permease component
MRRRLGITVRQAVLLAMVVVSLYPVWFLIQTALKTNQDYTLSPTGLPLHPTLDNLRAVISDLPVPQWALNSAIVTLASVGITTVIALLAAYAIVFSTMRLRETLLQVNLALMVVPPVALLIPMFIFMVNIGLINSLPSVIIFYSGLMLPFSVFFFVNFFRQFPMELIEAATVDGAKPLTILRRVVLPISAAATFTLVIVNAIWAWNELLIALVFLQDESRRTLMAGLTTFQGRYATNEPLVLAGAFVSILPVILVYLAGQRFFVRGLTAGIGK